MASALHNLASTFCMFVCVCVCVCVCVYVQQVQKDYAQNLI